MVQIYYTPCFRFNLMYNISDIFIVLPPMLVANHLYKG